MKKLEAFDSIFFIGKSHFEKDDSSFFIGNSHFEKDGTQNYLVFQPMYQYFKTIAVTKYILSSKPKGLSDESVKPPATSDNSLSPSIDYLGNKIRLNLMEVV